MERGIGSTEAAKVATEVVIVDSITGAPINASTDQEVVGNVAAGAADSGAPVKVGGVNTTTLPTLADGQRGNLQLGTRGSLNVQFILPNSASVVSSGTAASDDLTNSITAYYGYSLGSVWDGTQWQRARGDKNGISALPGLSSTFWQYAGTTGGITDTSDVALKAAAGASVRNYLSAIQFYNSAAVASEIVVKDGSTVIWRGFAPASMTAPASQTFPVPLKGTANTALNVAMITTATATRVSAQGFTGS